MLEARRCCTSVSPQEPGCEWINAPAEWLQPSEWPERAARDPKRPDPCALIKQLIPRRQVACLLAEWHYVVDAWSYGTSKTYSLHVHVRTHRYASTLSWRRCFAPGTEMRPCARTEVSQKRQDINVSADADAQSPRCIKFVRCEHRDLERGCATSDAGVKSRIFPS